MDQFPEERTLWLATSPGQAIDYERALEKLEDKHGIGKNVQIIEAPEYVDALPIKRKWIAEHFYERGVEKIFMIDDDRKFFARNCGPGWEGQTSSHKIEDPIEITVMLDTIEHYLDHFPHVGVGSRMGNNRLGADINTDSIQVNVRSFGALGYRVKEYLEMEHCRIKDDYEDQDIHLQLIAYGYDVAVLSFFSQEQKDDFNMKDGGCAHYRNLKTHRIAAHRLAELHPGLVRVRESDDGMTNITVSWKKAANQAKSDQGRLF